MKPCLMCSSENVYVYKKDVRSSGELGPELLPGLEPGWIKSADFRPVVCGDCGYIMFFAAQEVIEKLNAPGTKGWEREAGNIPCSCGYNLTGNATGTCPECGAALQPWRGCSG